MDRARGSTDDADDEADFADPILRRLAHAPPVSPSPAFSGTERFEILHVLGEGANGRVYEARDRRDGSIVAIKVLTTTDPDDIYRFKREFRSLSGIVHRNLVRFDELTMTGERWLIVMERIRGEPFDEFVAGSVERLRPALLELTRGLLAIHDAGKLHRDIKPSNVLVEQSGRVVLLDFGLAIETDRDVDTTIAGTPRYMAPERWRARGHSESSDWYSVGVMLYEALAGRPPLTGESAESTPAPSAIRSGVPADLERLCIELLDPDPAKRPTGRDVLARLSSGGETVEPRPVEGFVGRTGELERIEAVLERVRSGRPRVLVIEGAPGVGKTALLARARQVLTKKYANLSWFDAKCHEGESVPYKAFDGAVDAIAAFLYGLPGEARRAFLPRNANDLATQFPVFAKLFPTMGPNSEAADRRAAMNALRELLGRIADHHPVVIALDDLQWGDADSAAILEDLLRPPQAPLVAFLATCREGEKATSAFLSALTRRSVETGVVTEELRLGVLGEEDARALASEVAAGANVDVGQVARESGGNPLFIRELVFLGRDESGATVPTLSATIIGRVTRLGEDARRLLEAAAIADNPERPATLCKAAGVEADQRALVASLKSSQLLRVREMDREATVECYHDLIRETLLQSLSTQERRSLHRSLALVLSADERPPAERIARHYAAAGDDALATEYAVMAGRRAAASFAFEHAVGLFRLALDFSRSQGATRWELQRDLGDALAASGQGNEAADAFLIAAGSAPRDEAVDLRRRAATTLLGTGYIDRGLDVFRSVMHDLGLWFPRNSLLAAAALVPLRARIRFRGFDFTPQREDEASRDVLRKCDALRSAAVALQITYPIVSVELAARYLLLALDSGVVDRVLPALCLEAGYSAFTSGKAARHRTRDVLQRARTIAERIGDPGAMAWSLSAEATAALLEGRFSKAQRVLDEGLALLSSNPAAEKAWPDMVVDSARMIRFNAMWQRGLARDLHRELPPFLDDLLRRGNRLGIMWMSLYDGYVVAVRGDSVEGRARINRAMQDWGLRSSDMQAWWTVFANLFVDLYERKGELAWNRIQAVWPKLERALLLNDELHRIEARVMMARASLAFARENPSRTPSLLRIAEKHCTKIERDDAPWGNALAKTLRASVASFRGDRSSAELYLSDAIPLLEAQGLDAIAAISRRVRGLILGGREGHALTLESNAWMESQDIAEPAAFAAMYLPGPWE